MAQIVPFPHRRCSVIEIVEIEPGKWFGGIDPDHAGQSARYWQSHAHAAAFALGIASVTGLPIVDWNEPYSNFPAQGDAA